MIGSADTLPNSTANKLHICVLCVVFDTILLAAFYSGNNKPLNKADNDKDTFT